MIETKEVDFLASQIIQSLKKTDMASSWISDQFRKMKDMDRLEVLRHMSHFDKENLAVICADLNVSVEDMQATLRVLRKV